MIIRVYRVGEKYENIFDKIARLKKERAENDAAGEISSLDSRVAQISKITVDKFLKSAKRSAYFYLDMVHPGRVGSQYTDVEKKEALNHALEHFVNTYGSSGFLVNNFFIHESDKPLQTQQVSEEDVREFEALKGTELPETKKTPGLKAECYEIPWQKIDWTDPKYCIGGKLWVGRAVNNTLCIQDMTISRQHGCFSFENGRITYKHMSSSNAAIVNGNSLSSYQHVEIRSRDVIQFSPVVSFTYYSAEDFFEDVLSNLIKNYFVQD